MTNDSYDNLLALPVLAPEALEIQALHSSSREFYENRELRTEDRELARLLMLGLRPKRIAKMLGVSPTHVRLVRNSPAMQRHLGILNHAADEVACDLKQQIAKLAPDALGVIDEALHDETYEQSKKVDAAFRLLAIGGYGPTTRVKGEHVVAVADASLIREINEELANVS